MDERPESGRLPPGYEAEALSEATRARVVREARAELRSEKDGGSVDECAQA
jgi:hypothetical protein